ncbi:YfjI family protein [Ferrimonas sp.]|uniref:YfjI family protein n=1 Tax=Ferrimonas sp. TaxID=2080861 RepID=UPI003A95B304
MRQFSEAKGRGDELAASEALTEIDAIQKASSSGEPEITPLATELPPVMPFDYQMMPGGLADYVRDAAERIGCPPDFIGVAVMVALGSVIGNQATIKPKRLDSWAVTPNLWGALIGRPSTKKSPAMAEALRPLKAIAAEAAKQWEEERIAYEVERRKYEALAKAAEKALDKAAAGDDHGAIEEAERKLRTIKAQAVAVPKPRRYLVNDATVEKLGELMNENPNGLLLERDELTGWLVSMEREDRQGDRAFYLEAYNGNSSFTYDRIGRGTTVIESATLSVIGGIQPAKFAPYIANAVSQGAGDDGFVQRLQLAVYPDARVSEGEDRPPSKAAKDEAIHAFRRAADLPPPTLDEYGEQVGIRFDDDGQAVFNQWHRELSSRCASPDIHPAMESHLVKYGSLMPALALIINLVTHGPGERVTGESARLAVRWVEYLETHAARIYSEARAPEVAGAKLILDRRDKLPEPFRVKDVKQKGWAGLSKTEAAKASLCELVEHGYLVESLSRQGGRPSTLYRWNRNLRNA